jgi:protein-serine/threonine kinase
MNLDQIQLTVSNRSQINTWRKSRRQLAYSTVGTPDYIAPEIFSGQGYDYSCDWWSVGTIMFECLIGWPPFCAEEPHDTYRKIVDWPRNLHFPPDQQLSPDAEDFVKRYAMLSIILGPPFSQLPFPLQTLVRSPNLLRFSFPLSSLWKLTM